MKRIVWLMAAVTALGGVATAQERKGKTLVAYFSATGTTERAARSIAEATGSTLYEIQPAKSYTAADLNWRDESSRSSVEMADVRSCPVLNTKPENLADYDTVIYRFPHLVERSAANRRYVYRKRGSKGQDGYSVRHVGRQRDHSCRKPIAGSLSRPELAAGAITERYDEKRGRTMD